ncbi:MAG: VOC family protein [Clostridia bacterium]|nr:VOC family protein [Clostridia bacterium]
MALTNRVLRGVAFHHIALKAKDFDRSVEFYEALGCKLDFEWGERSKHIAMFEIGGGARMEIFADGGDDYVPNGRWLHLALSVENVKTAYEAAVAAGAKTVMAPGVMSLDSSPRKMTLQVAFVEGPDGEVIEFCKTVVPTI